MTAAAESPRPQENPLKGFTLAAIGTCLVSCNYITAKIGVGGFGNPEMFSLVWCLSAALWSLFYLTLEGRLRFLKPPREAYRTLTALGIATAFGMVIAWSGLKLIDPTFSAFLWRFTPVATMLLGIIFLGERITRWEAVAMGLMLVGGLASVVGRINAVGWGALLTVLGCSFSAIQMVMAKVNIHRMQPTVLVFYRCFLGAVGIGFWLLITKRWDFEVEAKYVWVTVFGALIGPCSSFLFTFRSYRYWDLSRSSMVLTMQPLFVLPMAILVFGKAPAKQELIGGSIIMAGAVWLAGQQWYRHRHMAKAKPEAALQMSFVSGQVVEARHEGDSETPAGDGGGAAGSGK